MNKYLTELIGTFFLVLTIGCTVLGGPKFVVLPTLAIGSVLMVMVYAGGHVSGAHYNPAVTLGVWMRGRCETANVAPYWVAQIVGALAAAFVTRFLVGPADGPPMVPAVGPALVAEFLFTFALVYVVLNVATSKGTAGKLVLRARDRHDRHGGRFASRAGLGRRLQSGRRDRDQHDGARRAASIWIHIVADLAGARSPRWLPVHQPDDK
jgi:aquaporin Z